MDRSAPRPRYYGSTLLCAAALLACILIAHPVLEMGFSDDFSYIFTAKRAAETGRLIYNGWACPMLGYMVYLAAAIIKVFGFSFAHARAAVVLIALADAAMLHRLFLRLVPNNFNAVVAACCVALGPVALEHSVLFFTDVPAMFAVVVALYGCIRAVQAIDAHSTVRWLMFATVTNLALGSVRQTAWLGALLLVPAFAWHLRRRRGVLAAGAAMTACSAAVVLLAVRWLARQPYAPQEALLLHYGQGFLVTLPILPVTLLTASLPLLVGFVQVGKRRLPAAVWAWCALLATVLAAWPILSRAAWPFFYLQGYWHDAIPDSHLLGAAFTWVCVFTLSVTVALALRTNGSEQEVELSFRSLFRITLPFLLVSMGLIMTREATWARYVLAVLPVTSLLLYKLYEECAPGKRLPISVAVTTAAVAVMATIIVHDDFATQRSTLALKDWYTAQGLPMAELDGGMAISGWYELETGHSLNEPRVRVPANAFHPKPMSPREKTCQSFFMAYVPDVQPRYRLTVTPTDCFADRVTAE